MSELKKELQDQLDLEKVQIVIGQDINNLEILKANINNDWQTTSAGSAEKKIVKTVQSEKSNYEESDYNEKNYQKYIFLLPERHSSLKSGLCCGFDRN